eukprot:gene28978-60466_t
MVEGNIPPIKIRDPAMKGIVEYSIPFTSICDNQGLQEYLRHRTNGTGQCCKSFHVESDVIKRERALSGSTLNDEFLSEVAIDTGTGVVA